MAANPGRYIELAHYRSIIQKVNRKFQWTAVYDYDVQFQMSLSENAKAGRLDIVDTTLYTMILDSSAVRKDRTSCQRCKSEHHLVRDCSFRRNRHWRIRAARKWAREHQETKVNNGNTRNGLQTTLRAAIYSSGELASKEPNAREPMYARLVGGTTLWLIANLLPAPKSPFTTSIWKHKFNRLS